MSRLNIVRRCYNCNTILQETDPEAEGYISPGHLDQAGALVLFCDHCYEQQKYNFSNHELVCSDDYLTMMKDAKATDALIVFVVDLFSFESSFPQNMVDIIANNPLLVIANKLDLLPKNVDKDEIREYVAHRFRAARLRVTKDDVILTSLNSLTSDPSFTKTIDVKRKRHDVYVVGAASSGKTLFLASYLRGYKNKTLKSVVTQNYPGTSLTVMQIPLDSSSSVYDTPATPSDNSMLSRLPYEIAKKCIPLEPVRPRAYSLIPGDALFLGGLARIELLKGKRSTFTFFGAKTVKTVRVRTKNSEEMFFRYVARGDLEPSCLLFSKASDFDVYDLEVDEDGFRDIGIAGYGWVRFRGDRQTIRISVPRGVAIYTSRSKIIDK